MKKERKRYKGSAISHALSPEARDYLKKTFDCTTHDHLMKLGCDGNNVFEENLASAGPNDDFYLDREISEYIKAVKEDREPYDPASHEFEVDKNDDGTWAIWFRGPATADEWEELWLSMEYEKPSEEMCFRLFNETVEPRQVVKTNYG